ncbi:MAG: hypothetical protein VX938_03155 [Myxococcota bacterium]|nr:hypothetical protein [Myxococcota bacterium]
MTTGTTSPTELLSQPNALRLTPEQVANRIADAFSYELTHADDEGYVYNDIIDEYGVSLGGIDLVTAARRDPAVKVLLYALMSTVKFWTA